MRDGPIRDGPIRDGPIRDGPIRDCCGRVSRSPRRRRSESPDIGGTWKKPDTVQFK
jgi:hypothetical protein